MKKFSWILILLVLGVILFPLARPGFFVSDDGDWMIIRLSAFFASFKEGQFPVRFLGRLNDSYGYPVANFLYPGFLYIGSFLHGIGLSFVTSIKAILAGSLVGAAFFIYGWLRKQFQPFSASLGAVGFVVLPYIGFDLYTRGSVGEILAFLGVAMCLYSIAKTSRAFFAVSFAFLILAHNSLALLFAVFLMVYLLNEKRVNTFLTPTLIGLGISSFFWIPAIMERSFTLFDSVQVARSQEYFISTESLYLVMSGLFIMGLVWILRLRHRGITFFFWCSGIAIFLASPWSSFLWETALFNRLLQFPFRFLSLLAVSVPFLIAASIEKRPKRYGWYILVFFVAIWTRDVSRTLASFQSANHPESYYLTNEATTTVQDEYLPRWASEQPKERVVERIVFYEGRGEITPDVFTRHAFRVSVNAYQESVLQINTLYYPGWGVAVDNRSVEIDYSNLFGLMRIPVSAGKHTVEVAFRETPFRFMVDCISVLSLAALVVLAVRERSRV